MAWMARPLRVEYPGAIYHVTGRMLGNWKKESNLLFEDDRDRLRFLERLGERVEQVMGVVARVLKMEVAEFSRQRRDLVVRGIATRMLCRYSGLTQREVAEVLGMGSGSGVCHLLRKLAFGN